MSEKQRIRINFTKFLLIFLILGSVVIFFLLPDQIPLSWNFRGDVIRYGGKLAIFIIPVLASVIFTLMYYSPKIDPKGKNYKLFENAYSLTLLLTISFLIYIQILIIHNSFIPQCMKITICIPVALGILFTFFGNILPTIRHNYFIGVKTPWTLDNEVVWHKTHRFTGKLWVGCGILMVINAFIPAKASIIIFFIIMSIMVIIPVVYSYISYRKLK